MIETTILIEEGIARNRMEIDLPMNGFGECNGGKHA